MLYLYFYTYIRDARAHTTFAVSLVGSVLSLTFSLTFYALIHTIIICTHATSFRLFLPHPQPRSTDLHPPRVSTPPPYSLKAVIYKKTNVQLALLYIVIRVRPKPSHFDLYPVTTTPRISLHRIVKKKKKLNRPTNIATN